MPCGPCHATTHFRAGDGEDTSRSCFFLCALLLLPFASDGSQPGFPRCPSVGTRHNASRRSGTFPPVRPWLPSEQRFELLDWYHLKEHLYAVGGSLRRLEKAEKLLWEGDVGKVISLFSDCKFKRANNFVDYITKHRTRIPEYGYLQQLGLTIGSGSVESSIKQIGRRIKISGAQWKKENVAQVLKHRCSYLNGYLYSPEYLYLTPN